MNIMNRRTFIQQSGSASLMAGAFIKSVGARSSPNDTVNIAVMGIHGRGGALMEGFAGLPNVNSDHPCLPSLPRCLVAFQSGIVSVGIGHGLVDERVSFP